MSHKKYAADTSAGTGGKTTTEEACSLAALRLAGLGYFTQMPRLIWIESACGR